MLALATNMPVCTIRLIKLTSLLNIWTVWIAVITSVKKKIWKYPVISYPCINFGLCLIPAKEITVKKPWSNEIQSFFPISTGILETLKADYFLNSTNCKRDTVFSKFTSGISVFLKITHSAVLSVWVYNSSIIKLYHYENQRGVKSFICVMQSIDHETADCITWKYVRKQ